MIKYHIGKLYRKITRSKSDPFGQHLPYCFDHVGEIKLPGDIEPSVLTLEPYGLTMDGAEELITFCKQKNLTFSISAASPYFPGETILIKLTKVKGGEKE